MTENDPTSSPGTPPPGTAPGSTSAEPGGTTTAPPPYPPPYDQPSYGQPSYGQPPFPPPSPRPPLRRSATDRKIAGVAGGLGRYFGVDPLIFRVVLVTLAIFGGSGLLLYAVGWLLVPEDGEQESEGARLVNGRATGKVVGGIILAIVGLVVVGNFARTGFGFGGFVALIALGVAAYLISRDGDRPVVPPRDQSVPPTPPTAPGAYGQTPGTAYSSPPRAYTSSVYAPPVASSPPAGSSSPPPPGASAPPGWYPLPPPRPAPPRSPLGRITASLAVVTAGALVAWNFASDNDVSTEVVLAACLAVVGLGLVVGAFVGRGRGLIILGAFLALATTAASFNPVGFRGGVGDRVWHPRSVEAVQDHGPYRLGVGDSRIDLTDLDLTGGRSVRVDARLGLGSLDITVPEGVTVRVIGDVQAGSVQILDNERQDGTDVHEDVVDPVDAVDATAPQLTIDAEIGVGELEVFRATS
jgi:phage shock protein PspC (stress-responsive transcriptional regulator)